MNKGERSEGALHVAYESAAMVAGLGFLALQCLIWLPVALVLHPLLPRRSGERFGRRVISWGARIYLRFLMLACGCRFDLRALDELRRETPLVLAANHPSLIDFLLIVSRFPNAVCVIKASLMDNLLFGAAARLAGYVSNHGPLEVVLGACHALERGGHLVIFPEASRTSHFPLDTCTESAALIAQRARVPIQTLLIGFSSPYLGKNWPLQRRPALPLRFEVRRGRRIAAQSDTAAMTRELEAALRGGLASWPDSAGSVAAQRQPDVIT